jgi:diguanylate cyclase (GGDEF)-like protein
VAHRRWDGAVVIASSSVVTVSTGGGTLRAGGNEKALGALLLGVAVFVLGYGAVAFSPASASVAAWWPAAGIAVAVVTTRWAGRRSLLTAVLVASVLANLAAGRAPAVAAGFAISNTAEVWIVAGWFVIARRGDVALRRLTDILVFALGALIGALTIGVGAVLTTAWFGTGDPRAVFLNVVPSHLTAVLLLAPLLMAPRAPISRSAAEQLGSWALTALITTVVFWPGQTLPLAFLPAVTMMWSAIRLGLRSTAAQLTFVAVTVTLALHAGGGFPVWGKDHLPLERISAVVQIYIVTMALVLYVLATALGERETALIQVRASEETYERLALTDSLTDLPNRVALVDQLNRALERARASSHRVAIAFFDLDDFKLVNDVYGHLAGDELLREMADRFRAVVGDHVLARIGGDEFVLMCPAVASIDEAMTVSELVVAAMDRPVTVHGIKHVVSISGGLTLSGPDKSSAQMLREADVALYAAKATGKRRLAVYSSELDAQASERVRIETELRSALVNSEFNMHMQPVINVQTGEIDAAEALIRWHHPTDGVRPPGMWLDMAERCGMMPELGAWALDRAITEAVKWIAAVGVERAPIVHVNVSARQLDRPGFDTMVLATLDRHRFPATKLILELTETFLAHVSAELVDELRLLHESGVRIAADDFGTGYSPLTRILELPISMIKIDRQFIWNAVDDHRSRAIVDSLLQLAATLDFDVVAEGVETSEQRDLLRTLDCRLGQGYYWSRPVAPEAFLAMLLEHEGTLSPQLAMPAGRH